MSVDVGAPAFDAEDDYPVYCFTPPAVVADPGSLGVVIGGSGNGEQIAANKVAGVRAALAWNVETAAGPGPQRRQRGRYRRPHAHRDEARDRVSVPDHPVLRRERHARRIAQVTDYETTHALLTLPAHDRITLAGPGLPRSARSACCRSTPADHVASIAKEAIMDFNL